MEMAGHALSPDQDDYHELLSDLLLKYQEGKEDCRPRAPGSTRQPSRRSSTVGSP